MRLRTFLASKFKRTREEARKGRMTIAVSLAPASTIRFLNADGKILHSLVALNRVPIWTPQAPSARAATIWLVISK